MNAASSYRAAWIAYGVVALAAALLLLPTDADPDLWGHIRYGLDILEQRTLTADIPYAYTATKPFLYHEWLGGVLMAIAYSLGGTSGLIILKLILAGTVLLAVGGLLRNIPIQIQAAALLTVLWALLPLTLTVRPQLWSVLGTVVVLASLRGDRQLRLVPPVMMLWANLHGGWIVGFGLVTIWSAYEFLVGRRGEAVALWLATAAVTFVNPFGIGLWQFVLETVRLERLDIQDWQPLWTAPPVVWGPWLVTITAAILALRSGRRPRLDFLVSVALFAYASLVVVRLVPMFVIIGVVYLSPSFAHLRAWRVTVPSRLASRLTVVPIAALAVLILLGTPHSLRTGCMRIAGDWSPDLAVGAALQRARPSGRLAVPFNWGHYAIWHLGPALQVSMDGRRETVYSDDTIRLQREVSRDSPEGREWLGRTRPEFIWIPHRRSDPNGCSRTVIAWMSRPRDRYWLCARISQESLLHWLAGRASRADRLILTSPARGRHRNAAIDPATNKR